MLHLTDDQLFDMLCQARDRLEAGPAEGPEHSELFRSYLDTRMQVFRRVCEWQRDPLPAMNRSFLVMNDSVNQIVDLVVDTTAPRFSFEGPGCGWAKIRALPPPVFVHVHEHEDEEPDPGEPAPEQDDEILCSLYFQGSPILSSKLLAIWRDLDADALDALPVRIAPRAGSKEEQDYWAVDVVRMLPAIDEARMGLRRFRNPFPHADRFEYFPMVGPIALREDLPISGVHLFRDEMRRDRLFVSVELARACYEAGAGRPYPAFEWPDEPGRGVDLKNLRQ
jgi:hypothetical protein